MVSLSCVYIWISVLLSQFGAIWIRWMCGFVSLNSSGKLQAAAVLHSASPPFPVLPSRYAGLRFSISDDFFWSSFISPCVFFLFSLTLINVWYYYTETMMLHCNSTWPLSKSLCAILVLPGLCFPQRVNYTHDFPKHHLLYPILRLKKDQLRYHLSCSPSW